MDATNIAIVIGAGSAAGASLVTVLLTKGIDGWLKLRADKRVDVVRDNGDLERILRSIIDEQKARIVAIEADLNKLHEQHNDCERRFSVLSEKFSYLEKELAKRARRGKLAPPIDPNQPGSAA